ncbi:MAG: hypothetical protein EZS26_003117 [Candidatus Ordinivivax streblomastigis]|jgi:hypothetical protein|uniref:DUF3408 domain-containing protein n=1 Tax=Candidatus Ordinivivax streblomastigis TaxID=2540710 RepID=A0A5M8NV60_9BACT|nr:MAG: hypothetical protein EZS26_003117 [Candidatus Ordinivivax streblomastigis]
MAKKINTDEIDESFIIAAVRKDRVQPEIVPPPLTPLPAVPPQAEQPPKEENTALPEPPKEEGKRKRNKQDYETLFIRESNITARLGKTVYIRKEFHDRIQKIVQVIGGNEVSLFSYIDNIIAHHFEMYQDDIVQLYNQKNNSIF